MLGAFTLLAMLAVAAVQANYFVIEPTAKSVWRPGKTLSIYWEENGAAPLGNSFGKTRVDICTGTATKQACHVSVGTTTSGQSPLRFKLAPNALCNDEHFLRFESVSAKDDQGVPLLAYSARFTISGMQSAKSIKVAAASGGKNATVSVTSAVPAAAASGGAANATLVAPSSASGSSDVVVSTAAAPRTDLTGHGSILSFTLFPFLLATLTHSFWTLT